MQVALACLRASLPTPLDPWIYRVRGKGLELVVIRLTINTTQLTYHSDPLSLHANLLLKACS
jgi:hypothetical protein